MGNDICKKVKLVARSTKQARAEPRAEGDIAVLVTCADSRAPADWTTGSPGENAVRREFVVRSLRSTFFSYLKIKKITHALWK